MLPSPAPSSNEIIAPPTPAALAPPGSSQAKGHLEPHISNLPRRRRPTQLPTPNSSTSDDVPASHLTATSLSSPRPDAKSPSQPRSSSPASSSPSSLHSASSSLFEPLQPSVQPIQFTDPTTIPRRSWKGHIGPSHSHIPRRRRPIEVIPGSGVFALPPSVQEIMDEDDSGMPEHDLKGDSRATVLARALLQLCSKEPWQKGMVEGVYMKLHDLGIIPAPWMGALRREGLTVVDQEFLRTTSVSLKDPE